jgi:hypothetical protein
MRINRTNTPSEFVIANEIRIWSGFALISIALLAFWSAPAVLAQSASSASTPPAQSQTPDQSRAPAPGTVQNASGDQPQSLADAARQAKANQDKPKAKKVYTDENMSSVGGTISVVGDKSSSRSTGDSDNSGGAPSASGKTEAYWRGRASAIKNEIASTDQQIDSVKAEIAKSGAASFDPSSGLSQGVIIVHDRNAEVKQLEERKQGLERQLDDLADEIRKAGGDSGWAR